MRFKFVEPLENVIIIGLVGVALAGLAAVVLADERTGTAAIRIRPGWRAPVGGLLMLICGVVAVAGFPLDDVWHTLSGEDGTLWGPTHIQMIGGASPAMLALWCPAATSKTLVRRPLEGARRVKRVSAPVPTPLTTQLGGSNVAVT